MSRGPTITGGGRTGAADPNATQQSRSLLETMIQSSPVAITVLDETARVLVWNPAAERLFGYSAEEVLGRPPPPAAQPPPELTANVQRTLAGRPLEGVEMRWRSKTGQPLDLMVWSARIEDPTDGSRLVSVAIDIGERKRMERALHASEERLREKDREKDRFLATLAHELRNPLAPIRSALDLLRETANDPETVHLMIEILDRQSAQLVRLVEDLLDVSRISRGVLDLRPERVDVREVLAAAVETSAPALDRGRHTVSIDVPAGARLRGDRGRLVQIFSNLLNNAARHGSPGGHIDVRVERDDDEIVVRVHDDGPGIPKEVLANIFELFVQGSRDGAGLGIGLTLVRRLVELHGGRVEIDSEPGQGTTVSVWLPRRPRGDVAPSAPSAP